MVESGIFNSKYSHPGVTMTKHLSIIAFLFYTALLSGIIDEEIYKGVLEYLNGNDYFLAGGVLFVSLSLVAVSIIFSAAGSYRLVFCISKISLEVSQFCIGLLALPAIGFYVHFDLNLWNDLSNVIFTLPFLFLFASAYSIRVFDFNYPVRNTIAYQFYLVIFSGLVIFVGEMAGY